LAQLEAAADGILSYCSNSPSIRAGNHKSDAGVSMRARMSDLSRACISVGLAVVWVLAASAQFTSDALGQDRPAATSTTLTKLFPDLASLSDAKSVAIGVGWLGLSPLSPVSAGYFLELHNERFEAEGRFKMASASATRPIKIPRDVLKAFLTTISDVELTEGEYQPRINHTDDYPSLEISVQTAQGPLKIWTNSQPRKSKSGTYVDRTPWAISYLGRTFVVETTALDDAFEPIEPHLEQDEVFNKLADQISARNRRPQ
jgi:hypothetical protein